MSMFEPDPGKNVNLTIDGIPVTVPEGTTILEAAKKVNVKIPTFCDHPDLTRRAVCRLCVVECDGRSKLVPACANEVWEGVSVVTHNVRILEIRKTITELLLASHPKDCLACARNKKCDLQILATIFGKDPAGNKKQPFLQAAPEKRTGEAAGRTLVRDMNKCVKCGRCTAVCQEIQNVQAINTAGRSADYRIDTPYREALDRGPCIYCGQCSAVCPVGAIYEYEQVAEVRAALNDKSKITLTQISSLTAKAMDNKLGLRPGTITIGKMVTALKELGFVKVMDSGYFINRYIEEESSELLKRLKQSETRQGNLRNILPIIISCSPAVRNLVRTFYPELKEHLPVHKSPEHFFGAYIKAWLQKNTGRNPAEVINVSIMPCIPKKFIAIETEGQTVPDVNFSLTTAELALMFHTAGIDLKAMPESSPDCIEGEPDSSGIHEITGIKALLGGVYSAYTGKKPEPPADEKIKVLTVKGIANARVVLESITRNECNSDLVHIISCINCSGCQEDSST